MPLSAISIVRAESSITIEIADNGKGFDTNLQSQKHGGFGLLGMGERVRMLNGTFLIESESEKGTKIFVSLEREKGRKGEGEISR